MKEEGVWKLSSGDLLPVVLNWFEGMMYYSKIIRI